MTRPSLSEKVDNPFLTLFPNKAKLQIKPIRGCDPRHWNETASVAFSHGAPSHDLNKMVLSFPIVWPNFFINTFTWCFQCSDINWILRCASANEILSSVSPFFTTVSKKFFNIQMKFLHATYYYATWRLSLWMRFCSEASLAVVLHGVVLFILSNFEFY